MAALHDRRARLLASLYAKFGEAAAWTSALGGAAVPCTIRRKGVEDIDVTYGQGGSLAEKDILKVRASEIPAPGDGDLVAILADDGVTVVETFRLISAPRRIRGGLEWACEPGPVRSL